MLCRATKSLFWRKIPEKVLFLESVIFWSCRSDGGGLLELSVGSGEVMRWVFSGNGVMLRYVFKSFYFSVKITENLPKNPKNSQHFIIYNCNSPLKTSNPCTRSHYGSAQKIRVPSAAKFRRREYKKNNSSKPPTTKKLTIAKKSAKTSAKRLKIAGMWKLGANFLSSQEKCRRGWELRAMFEIESFFVQKW